MKTGGVMISYVFWWLFVRCDKCRSYFIIMWKRPYTNTPSSRILERFGEKQKE